MSVDAKRLAATLMDVVRAWVEPAFAAVVGRVEALEKRAPRDGKDGKDAAPVNENAIVARVLEQIPAPKDGRDGVDGKDVELMVVAQYIGEAKREILDEVEERVAALPQPKDGTDGRDGESIHPDTVRAMVADQVRLQIADIPRPKDGEPGRDATAIDYRDGIDEEKSYPKGTHALYHGGVIVATRATDPIEDNSNLSAFGWAVAVNGLYLETEDSHDDGRLIRRVRSYTNGKTVVSDHKTAIALYRGVWKHDVEYSRGDMVTWDGSVWHCEAETTKARPGSGADFKLAVKRGNHGKDGK